MFNFSFFNCVQEYGPHGEAFRFVYNHSSDTAGLQLTIPIGGVPAPDFVNLCWDDQPFGLNFPPGPVRAAINAAELFAIGNVPRFGTVPTLNAPNTAHQSDKGIVSYTQAGVVRQEAAWPKTAIMQRHPMGVCVWEWNAFGQNQDVPDYVTAAEAERLYVLKVKGIAQALVDADAENITTGDYLEMQNASFNLVLDAADANRGTFFALEVVTTDNTRIWVWIAGVNGYAG